MPSNKKNIVYFSISLLLFLLVVTDVAWWIYASSDTTKTFEDVKHIYFNVYPKFLNHRGVIEFLSISFLGLSVYLLVLSRRTLKPIWIINLLIVLSFILMAWRFFSLL